MQTNRLIGSATAALVLAILTFIGCSPNTSSTDSGAQNRDGTLLKSSLARDTAPDVPPADVAALVAGNNAFAWDLYAQLRATESGNIFCSPFSISIALAMAYAGARTETETEMKQALHYMLDQERLHAAFNALDLQLMSRGQGAQGRKGEGFTLRIANAIWGERTWTFLPSFLDVIAVNYGAGMRLVDFANQPEQCRVTINDWVYAETEKKINDLIPAGIIDPLTVLVLVNAVYFDAAWADTFVQKETSAQMFYLNAGDSVSRPFMHKTAAMKYSEGAGFQAVELPYDGGEVSMVLIRPATGSIDALENSLDRATADAMIAQMTQKVVRLSLPKFSFRFGTVSLVNALKAMGMIRAFGGADFSGIDGSNLLYINDILHQAFVAVDEKGTTAAAATAVVMNFRSGPPLAEVEVTLDRPFVFFIRDVSSGQLLFIGRVMNPVKE